MAKQAQIELCPAGRLVDARLKRLGKDRNWLATELGVRREVLWRWLVGARLPSMQSALKLEEVIGIKPATWFRAA